MLQTGIMFDPNQITLTYLEGKPMWWLAEKISEKTNNTEEEVYAVLGDGEIEEGQIWEAAMTASHYKLNNLIVFVDYNNLQIEFLSNCLKLESKFRINHYIFYLKYVLHKRQ